MGLDSSNFCALPMKLRSPDRSSSLPRSFAQYKVGDPDDPFIQGPLQPHPPEFLPKKESNLKIMCSSGGHFALDPVTQKLKYAGGDTKLLAFPANIPFVDFQRKIEHLYGSNVAAKYQLPDVDTLISVTSDDDLELLLEECILREKKFSARTTYGQSKYIRMYVSRASAPLVAAVDPGDRNSSPGTDDVSNQESDLNYFSQAMRIRNIQPLNAVDPHQPNVQDPSLANLLSPQKGDQPLSPLQARTPLACFSQDGRKPAFLNGNHQLPPSPVALSLRRASSGNLHESLQALGVANTPPSLVNKSLQWSESDRNQLRQYRPAAVEHRPGLHEYSLPAGDGAHVHLANDNLAAPTRPFSTQWGASGASAGFQGYPSLKLEDTVLDNSRVLQGTSSVVTGLKTFQYFPCSPGAQPVATRTASLPILSVDDTDLQLEERNEISQAKQKSSHKGKQHRLAQVSNAS